jgi:hypothetical protein
MSVICAAMRKHIHLAFGVLKLASHSTHNEKI